MRRLVTEAMINASLKSEVIAKPTRCRATDASGYQHQVRPQNWKIPRSCLSIKRSSLLESQLTGQLCCKTRNFRRSISWLEQIVSEHAPLFASSSCLERHTARFQSCGCLRLNFHKSRPWGQYFSDLPQERSFATQLTGQRTCVPAVCQDRR